MHPRVKRATYSLLRMYNLIDNLLNKLNIYLWESHNILSLFQGALALQFKNNTNTQKYATYRVFFFISNIYSIMIDVLTFPFFLA
jgi:hypothetical protein